MKEKVRSIYDYDPQQAFEHIPGKSETVPCESTDLKELVRRSMLVGRFDFPPLENGPDEDFEDAFEPGQDLADYSENLSFIERYSARIKEVRQKAAKAKTKLSDDNLDVSPPKEVRQKAAKAKTKLSDDNLDVSPPSDSGIKENAPGEV